MTADGAGNVTAQVNFNDGDFFSFGRIATGPGGVVVGTYACNTIQNGGFSNGVTNWTISAGWYDNGGTAYNYLDNVVDNTLKQTISGLNAAHLFIGM